MSFFAVFVLASLSIVAFLKWRLGLFLTLVMALGQDPLRKLIIGEPAAANLMAGVVLAAAIAGSLFRNPRLNFSQVFGRSGLLPVAMFLLLSLILLQAMHSLIRFGDLLVTTLGLVSYLSPIMALIFASRLYPAERHSEVASFLWFYAVLGYIAITTIWLEQVGVNSPLFGEVGEGITIYDMGTVLIAHSGIFRASEIAAWHVATVSCVIIMLLTYRRPNIFKFMIACILVGLAIYVGTLTGRRKFLMMIAIFLASYIGLLIWPNPRLRGLASIFGIMGLMSFLLLGLDQESTQGGIDPLWTEMTQAQMYIGRTGTVFDDGVDRFLELGIAPIIWAYNRTGLLGAGLGVGTQGAQHLGGFGWLVGGASEGGLGRLMVELGAPGLLLVFVLLAALARRVLVPVLSARQPSISARRLYAGLAAILVSNAASFSIGQGMYGDIFVLIFNGIVLGALLAAGARVQSSRVERGQKPTAPAFLNEGTAAIKRAGD